MFNDYIRELDRTHLLKTCLPYTEKQAEVIKRLLTAYSTDINVKEQIAELDKDISTIQLTVRSFPNDVNGLLRYKPVYEQIDKFVSDVYKLPANQVWVRIQSIIETIELIMTYVGNDTKLKTLVKYLSPYKQDLQSGKIKTFESQLVSDITTLLMYDYHHPETVLALEQAKKVLSFYYTPTEASKLFVIDVISKIDNYIADAVKSLPKSLIERFKAGKVLIKDSDGDTDIDEQEKINRRKLEIARMYERFVEALHAYMNYKTEKQTLIECATMLEAYPYKDVAHLVNLQSNLEIYHAINFYE